MNLQSSIILLFVAAPVALAIIIYTIRTVVKDERDRKRYGGHR